MIRMLGAVILAATLPAAASATVIFEDNFDTETFALNGSLSNWTVSKGTIDVIGTGYFDLYPGNGRYLDMDGSTMNAGRIDTKTTFGFTVGATYTLSFSYGKNGFGAETLEFGVAGVDWTLLLPAGAIATLQTWSQDFVATVASSKLFFEALGGDNFGPVLDNVRLAAKAPPPAVVPLPAAAFLLLGGLGLLGALRRRT